MAGRLQLVSELAEKTAQEVTHDAVGWKRYLNTASRLYKYSFEDQLLIYAQRPDAAACAPMELWNEKMRRWVKGGSKSIALIRRDGGRRPYLKYVFDVADTRPVQGAREPYLWEMREEHYAHVMSALEARYGETKGEDMGRCLMETAAHSVEGIFRERYRDLAGDTMGSFQDDSDREAMFRDILLASVRYTLFVRCGLDPSAYLDDKELDGITEFSNPAALHHLGDAVSTLSMEILLEIGRTIRRHDRENVVIRQKETEKPLEKAADIIYTMDKEKFNTLKRESKERSTDYGRTDLHEERRLPDTRSGHGRGGRSRGDASGQVRAATPELSSGAPSGDIHLNAPDRTAHAAPAPDRPTGTGTDRPDGSGTEEAEGSGRSPEGTRPDGLGKGGEQLYGTGGGDSPERDRVRLSREVQARQGSRDHQEAQDSQETQENNGTQEAAGEGPAVFVSGEADTEPVDSAPERVETYQLSLFPTVEEQIGRITQAQAAERQTEKGGLPVSGVPEAVVDRALTSGGNQKNSILRIVSFFQRAHTAADAAVFLEKEYGTGGKGLSIGGREYALWFDGEGIHIAPGRTTHVSGCTVIPWEKVAEQLSRLLREGMYATQETLDGALEYEYQELAEALWYLRRDFSKEALDHNFLPRITELYGGFTASTEKIAGLLKEKEGLTALAAEVAAFADAYENDHELMRSRPLHNPKALAKRIDSLNTPAEQFRAVEGFEPAKGSFITEDEIGTLLAQGSNVSEGKLRIYSYFVQGHNAKERADFLQEEYGIGGPGGIGYDTWHDSKGIKITRKDDFSGYEGYDTVRLNWNQVQKRIGKLIDAGHYLNTSETAYMPEYEKITLARSIYSFYFHNPNSPRRSQPKEWDINAAERDYRPMLDSPKYSALLYEDMVETFAALSPEVGQSYRIMQKAIEDMAAYQRGEYSLFTPLPEEILQRQRDEARREKEAEKAKRAVEVESAKNERAQAESTSEKRDEKPSIYELDAAARALARKQRGKTKEGVDGQLVLDFAAMAGSGPAPTEPSEPAQEVPESDELQEAKDLITDFVYQEYGNDEMDFDDLNHLGLAFTTTEDEQHEIIVEANLLDFSISQLVDDVCVDRKEYGSLRELIDNELSSLDFGELVRLDESVAERLRTEVSPEKIQGAEPIPEQAEEEEPSDMVEIEGGMVGGTIPLEPALSRKPHETVTKPNEAVRQRSGQEFRNFRITDDALGTGGQKTKYQNNIAAIRTLKQIEAESRLATPQEQEILSKYVGWGGISQAFDPENEKWAGEYRELKELLTPEEYESARGTVLNAHYTSPIVIKAVYEVVKKMDYVPGSILEPSCGTGNFFGLVPEEFADSSLYGVELDSLTGRIAGQLYQKADITISGFENTDFSNDFFDLAVGNVPFGEYKVHDRDYDRQNLMIHDYFLVKTLDKVRSGGIIAFLTSKGTMDKANSKVREALAQKADLLGAVRLPNNAFKANAGTEVTADILFFQKRAGIPEKLPEWVQTGQTQDGIPMNSYFLEHPEMVLGRMEAGAGMYGNATETACIPIEGADLSAQLAEAVTHIAPPDRELLHLDAPMQEEGQEVQESIPADPGVRNFSFTEKGGKLYFRENSRMALVEPGKTPAARIRGMIQIRDSARRLIDLQLEGAGDEEIKEEQAHLNTLYDRFSQQYGLLNSVGNSLAFRQDSSYPLLCSLEVLDEEGNLERKADIFNKRTIMHREPVTSVDTAVEALGVSIGERACVDLGFMASLMGGSDKIPQIVSDLRGIIFKDPDTGSFDLEQGGTDWYKGWQAADEYLSGNVREKLNRAREAALKYSEFAANVEALEKVQPKDLTAPEISVRVGAPWIDTRYYKQFLFELLQTPVGLQNKKIDVLYSDVTGEWTVKGKSADSSTNARVWNTYGTKRINAYAIFESSLNQRSVQIFDTYTEDGKEVRVQNEKETAIAQQKQDALKEAFRDWIFKDPDRRADLCATYNRLFNSTRPREYDGQHISFSGMNPEISLETHQRNAVARILYGGNTLLAHVVGAGKTYEMVAAAMESKRLGLCRKSMIVVPNHLTEQWGGDFLTLYPGAKVLVATKKDFEPKNRRKFCARVATGDYDAVIIGHSQFEKIPISPDRQAAIMQAQVDEITEAIREAKAEKEERFTIKQMERMKKNLEAKIKKLYDKKKDDTVTFEELGIDRLFVDEAHFYKNLFLYTKMRNVAGISQTDAQKSSDMFAKCQYMDEITGGRGVIFATGTPVSNSMVELYTMMRYLQYEMLERGYTDSTGKTRSLLHFDNWAATFGEQVTAVELKPEGTGFRLKTRFARFYNLPELMSLWKEAADIQTADMLNLPVPEAEYITIQTEPSEAQKRMVQGLAKRAEKIRREKIDPSIDNMLKITSDGRKLALDQRILNPLLPDDPGSKVNACVENVFNIWQESTPTKGTQIIFSDLSTPKGKKEPQKEAPDKETEEAEAVGTEEEAVMEASVYEDIRKKLIAKGIPAGEIAFIHDAKTEKQKADLFAKVRSGQVRVLLGSTAKMGAGTNVQTKLVASHDLDCPWRPADLEQRAGRIVRRGNENKKVRIFRYVTKGTFDAYTWGLVESKQKFIGQIMTGKSPARSVEDVDATALSYAEVKMLATGDVRIKEKMDLDIQVTKLKMLKANHQAQQYEMQDRVRGYYPNKIKETQLYIDCLNADMPVLAAHPVGEDYFTMTVMGTVYTERKEAGQAIIAACHLMDDPGKEIELGEYRGFPMKLGFDGTKFKVTMKQRLTYSAELSSDVVGNITRINNALERIPHSLEMHRANLATFEKELQSAKEEADRPFPQEEELAQKSARLAELNAVLDNEEKGSGQGTDNREQEDTDEKAVENGAKIGTEGPAREGAGQAEQEDGKSSILKELRGYEAPTPVSTVAERSREWR